MVLLFVTLFLGVFGIAWPYAEASVEGCDRVRPCVGDKDRNAVGGLDAENDAGNVGYQAIAAQDGSSLGGV